MFLSLTVIFLGLFWGSFVIIARVIQRDSRSSENKNRSSDSRLAMISVVVLSALIKIYPIIRDYLIPFTGRQRTQKVTFLLYLPGQIRRSFQIIS